MTTLEIILLCALIYFLMALAIVILLENYPMRPSALLAIFGFALILPPWFIIMAVRYIALKLFGKRPRKEDKE